MTAPGEPRPRRLRLFYALWPSDSLRAALWAAARPVREQAAGQPVPPGNLHVTLAFLGAVPGPAFAGVVEVGGQGPWPAVALDFTRIEFWAKPGVLVAMPAEVPPAGQEIVDRLWRGLEPLGFAREQRPWRPHLTLARRIRRPPPENLALGPLEAAGDEPPWRLALVDSTTHADGPRYKPLADWPMS